MQFHAKYPIFDSQSDREFTFNYAIQINIGENLPQRGSYREAHKSGTGYFFQYRLFETENDFEMAFCSARSA